VASIRFEPRVIEVLKKIGLGHPTSAHKEN
jgi:hypothetical protein